MTALTRNDLNKIIYGFDQAHFGTPKPSSAQAVAQKHVQIHQLEQVLENCFPLEFVDKVVRYRLTSSPSVGALLMYYRSPAPVDRAPKVTLNLRCLEGASRDLLIQLGQVPTQAREELACFKQLMTSVFTEHFNALSIPEQLEIVKKIAGMTWEVQNVLPGNDNIFAKLAPLQRKLQVNQAGWSKTKVQLQVLSWKVQLVVAALMQTFVFQAGLMLGSFYCAYKLSRLVMVPLRDNLGKLGEWAVRCCFRPLGHTMTDYLNTTKHPTWLALSVTASVILLVPISAVLGLRFLSVNYMRYENRLPPMLRNALTYLFMGINAVFNNPNPFGKVGPIVNIGILLNRAAQGLTDRVSQSMDQAAVTAAQKEYIEKKIPHLLGQWHRLALNS